MSTPLDYTRRAEELWNTLTASEQGLVAFGIFAKEKMEVAEMEGYETHPLVVALMVHQRACDRTESTHRRES